MIWAIITEERKTERERSGDRMEGGRMSREVEGGERVWFFFLPVLLYLLFTSRIISQWQ